MVQSYLQVQVFLVDHLYEWEITSLLVNVLSDIMQACFRSCAGPRVGAWLLTCPTTPTFYLSQPTSL